jgi:large subunit ribosomal protein L7/L12
MSEPTINKGTNAIEEIVEKISGLSVVEVSNLIDRIKEAFNIKESLSSQASLSEADDKSEKPSDSSKVSVILTDVGPSKIQVYKIISSLAKSLENKDINVVAAKALTVSDSKIILSDISKEDAQKALKELESAGAKAEIK